MKYAIRSDDACPCPRGSESCKRRKDLPSPQLSHHSDQPCHTSATPPMVWFRTGVCSPLYGTFPPRGVHHRLSQRNAAAAFRACASGSPDIAAQRIPCPDVRFRHQCWTTLDTDAGRTRTPSKAPYCDKALRFAWPNIYKKSRGMR